MIIQTHAIVISSIKYGDSGKIIKCYTEEQGVKTFIVKDVYSKKNKKNAFFFPLNFLDIIYIQKENQELTYLKEIKTLYHFESLYTNPTKSSVALFISEILNQVIKEEETNKEMFKFIENSILSFDKKNSGFADFHLWFLFHLSGYLGFFPNLDFKDPYFDMENGVSTKEFPGGIFLEKDDWQLFQILAQMEFQTQNSNLLNRIQRNSTLLNLIKYFELHIYDFRRPKSLEVLNSIFS